jgi:pimeloyl-ACP methyl ester carboxylesterase
MVPGYQERGLSRGLKSEFRADGVFLGSSCQRSFVVWFRLYPEYRVCRTPPQPLPCVCMASLAFCRQSFLVVALRLVILLVILAGIPGAALISGYAPRESLPQNAGAPTGVTPAQPAVGATAPGPARASAAPPPIPGPSRPPIVVPARTEEGTLGASSFRIDLPLGDAEALLPTAVGQRRGLSAVSGSSNAAAPFMGPVTGPAVTPLALPYPAWNHRLVVYLHGYQAQPQLFRPNLTTHAANLPSRLIEQLLARGYAVAQPGYSTGGWAIATAPADIEALRRYFTQVNGAPTATFVVGQSMGGLLAVLTLEQQWREYAGGLALCGVLTPADLIMQRAFANRVAFDAFFPGILPDVEHIPADFHMNDSAAAAVVEKALNAHPPEAELLRSLADIHSNRGLADVLVFNTFVIEDLRLKAGGNPFDNRNLIYTGTTDDNALNARVRRYAADPAALRYIAMYGSPSGDLRRPLLALHTTYDPLVPASTAGYYDELTRRLGVGERFVQQYVDRDGHCNITPEQVGIAFDELTNWVDSGRRPIPGRLPDNAGQKPVHATPQITIDKPKNIGKPQ